MSSHFSTPGPTKIGYTMGIMFVPNLGEHNLRTVMWAPLLGSENVAATSVPIDVDDNRRCASFRRSFD